MIRHATDVQESVLQGVSSPPLPADHVLNSGAVLFPGAFDQHGCHLIVFPVDGQAKLSSALSKAEVVHFINYFLCLYNKMQEKESLVSVVADLTHASLPTTRFIAETLLLLELHKRTIHTVYITKPLKKDVFKLLLKILAPSKSHAASFKRVFLKGIPELSNYIDKSQLTTSLGGYFIYSHQSWVAFIKEIDAFVLEFLSVVQQLPSFISALQALSRLPLPATFNELHHFSSTNKAKFQQLRRELGLDELLRHCESMVQKLRHPEMEPCYQAMAGTALFTHTAFDMLQNHSRITAAVEKVEMLLQQAFSKANLQLQVFQLQEDALLITEQIETLQEKLQPYKVEIAKDAAEGVNLVSQFEASIHTPAMALVRCAEDLIHTLAEILPFDDQSGEHWVLDLERLKEKLQSTVHIIVQTLRAVSNYHHCYNKANHWYSLVLCENFLQELLSGVTDRALPQQQRRNWESIPAWRHRLSTFLKKNPPPSMEELLYLAHLSIAIPDKEIQQKGKKMSQQCMILRKLLISSGPVAVSHVQLALQWQFELLRSSHVNLPSGDSATNITTKDVKDGPSEFGLTRCETAKESGFDGTMISQLKAGVGREGVEVLGKPDRTRDSGRPATPQIPKECVSGFEDDRLAFDFGSVENSSRANFQIIPKETMDFLNFEIQVNRSAALPSNPWLSLPIDNLEHSYTVTITQNPTPQQRDVDLYGLSDPHTNANRSDRSQDQPTQTELLSSIQSRDGILHSQSNLEDPEQSSIGDMLSSAITDVTEKSTYTTEGNPTLLWDSYDLHDQNRNPLDGVIDISLKDWDMKEQEGLTDVKKILDRTNEILEEEENILAQEAVLEALLRSEDEHNPWPLCDSEDHLCVMSSSKLSKAGVIGLKEDYFDPAKSNDLSDLRSTGSSSETKAPEDDAYCTGDATEADAVTFHSRLDLLTELREVHVLDKLFIEENLKICELRHCENPNNKLLGKKPSDTNGLSVSKEMEVFALQLEKEKGEVQKLEKSLDKEVVAKKHKDRAKKVVTCSIMEKARTDKEDRPLCDELLSGRCKTPQRTYQDHNEDTCKVENIQAELGSDVTEEASPPDDVPQCQDLTCFKADPTLHSEHMLNSTYDLKEPKPEISLTPEMRLHDGSLLPPVPKPRKASLPVNCSLREPKTHSPEQLNPALFSTAEDPGFVQLALQDEPLDALIENVTPVSRSFVLNSNVKECRNNNSNHPEKCRLSSDQLSGITTKHGEDTPVIPSGLLQIDLHPTLEIQSCSPTFATPHQQSAPQLPCDQPLEFDPSGRDEVNEDLPDGVESFEAMKISSRSGSPGNQAQLNINIREMMDFNTPIVLDTGSGLMKAGFADQDLPSIIFPTVIGLPKYEEIMNGNLDKETYIGHEAQHMRGVLTLKHPIKNGIINNWDEMEKIWHHTFQQLCVDPEDHPVLLTEAAMNPLENRQHMVEIMFECFNVPFIYMAMQAMLALYSTGRSTGVVFDSGDGTSHSVPVFEGYCLPHAVQRFPLAGADVTMQLIKLLQEQGVNMHTTAEVEIAREMKEMCCCVALDYEAELAQRVSSYREMHYTMPDGQIVTLSTERFRAPEILFKPELIGQDHYGMHESIFKSILSSDIDLRRSFLGNIVLSGGNTLLPGLAERLQAEIKSLVPPDLMESICVASPIDRVFSVWRGGALMANLPTFSSAWISREEYEEHGPQIVFRKCF